MTPPQLCSQDDNGTLLHQAERTLQKQRYYLKEGIKDKSFTSTLISHPHILSLSLFILDGGADSRHLSAQVKEVLLVARQSLHADTRGESQGKKL